MTFRPAAILVLLLALAACDRATPAPAGDRIERGTALPPPGLTHPAR